MSLHKNKAVYRLSLVLLALVLLVAFGLALASSAMWGHDRAAALRLTPAERQWLAVNGNNLIVCAEPYSPPLTIVKQGRITGMVSDYYDLIEKRLDIRFKRLPAPSFAEMLSMAREGKVDIVGPVAQTPERSQYLRFSQTIIEYPTVIVVERNDRRALELGNMRGMRIAVTKGYAVWDYLWRYYPGLNYVPVKDDSEGLRMVAFRQVDAAITDLGTASYTISQQDLGNLRIAGQTGYRYVLSFASRRDQPELNAILTKTIASIPQRERDEIYRRWVTMEYSPYFLRRGTLMALGGFALLALAGLAAVVLWNKSLSRRVTERTAELNAYRDQLEQRVLERTAELEAANRSLEQALAEVRELSGIIPICSSCHKIRDDAGYWNRVEDYLAGHAKFRFSHGICPDCLRRLYPDYADFEDEPEKS